jgi:hypothetical protein
VDQNPRRHGLECELRSAFQAPSTVLEPRPARLVGATMTSTASCRSNVDRELL